MTEFRADGTGTTPSPGPATHAPSSAARPLWTPTGAQSGGAGQEWASRARDDQADDADASHRQRDRDAVRRRPSTAWSWVRETGIILVSALVLSLVVKTFLVQAFFIPSQSMRETLVENDRILVTKLTPGPFDLRRGDVAVFKDPGGWLTPEIVEPRSPFAQAVNDGLTFIGLLPQDAGEHLVKRVIGLPGDHVVCAGPGQPITVNGVALDEPYLAPGSQPSERAFDVVVPAGSLWVMGDNRQHSADSRYNQGRAGGGSVPVANVVGVAFVTVWPVDRFTTLRNPTETFANVPDAG
ncbi:signal peptidase I [Cellulomonas sp. S1-8]|uniref:signal peptidase I n=1 Tax=Cellulomonas sp. S1-8 TaxID=2904790 RepID=UPI0022436AF6|nr:signal peptidase I [Cellulomonas sp. S1-8]UZN04834.1 signal peptidase I [Cellulomonas sp. S1-8]